MKVCVFAASSSRIDPAYIKAAEELGAELPGRVHAIFGGGGIVSWVFLQIHLMPGGGSVTVSIPAS
jgi:hypothetical protein